MAEDDRAVSEEKAAVSGCWFYADRLAAMEKRWLMRDGSDLPVSNGEAPLSCQDAFMIEAEEAASHAAVKPHGVWQKMTARFRKKKQGSSDSVHDIDRKSLDFWAKIVKMPMRKIVKNCV